MSPISYSSLPSACSLPFFEASRATLGASFACYSTPREPGQNRKHKCVVLGVTLTCTPHVPGAHSGGLLVVGVSLHTALYLSVKPNAHRLTLPPQAALVAHFGQTGWQSSIQVLWDKNWDT